MMNHYFKKSIENVIDSAINFIFKQFVKNILLNCKCKTLDACTFCRREMLIKPIRNKKIQGVT